MDDLIDDSGPARGRNEGEYTVSEISGAVKRTLEDAFGRIRVKGEIGRIFRARSGHLYYDIKDDRNVLACTTWKGQVSQLSVAPEEGMEVVVTGKLSAFGAQSKYNLNVEAMEVAGAGALMAMLEKRRVALAAEGVFDPSRKRPLPFLPEVIGVVTSPQGAVIRDILHRLRDRFPRHVLIWPVAVQGRASAPEVANAIRGFNALPPGGAIPRPDLLIVARGGGSIEDLWGFNEEIVVRAAAESAIPLISAVGHETDTTLIDHASDRRAPTPTAAAEMAVPVRLDLLAHVDGLGARQARAARGIVAARGQRLTDLSRGLPRADALLAGARQRLDLASDRLPATLRARTARARVILSRLEGRIVPAALTARLADRRRRLAELGTRLDTALPRATRQKRARLDLVHLRPAPLMRLMRQDGERLAGLADRLVTGARGRHDRARDRLAALDRLRLSLGYERTLDRGFAVIRDGDRVLTDSAAVRAARIVTIQFAGGDTVDAAAGQTPPRGKPKPPAPDQGSLF
ncbi:exodeoxyribonuclease VII large subunit [Jannaschia rubra]|uniref:Exodeoxyribonuclease 7 large subunit n=1 Tax=Jannaschia rubra TaxID=282197 RepID=A0A0M6XSY8_9RHOB|nr:exodeoxyribonuclease VII large subunit [Jannaschia rubra]CTQ34296.1 Exodeoxyribonuclease 7 large subunit [Jannaschia rubra]SFG18557.1 Exodeoxyribonuclease VII large subunit [Jannaschia rubra]